MKKTIYLCGLTEKSLLPESVMNLYSGDEYDAINETLDVHERFRVFVLTNQGLINNSSRKRLLSPTSRSTTCYDLLLKYREVLENRKKEDVFLYLPDRELLDDAQFASIEGCVTIISDIAALRAVIAKPNITRSFNFSECTAYRSGISGLVDLRGTLKANQHVGGSLAYINDSKPALLKPFLSVLEKEKCFLDNGIVTYNARKSKNANVKIPTATEMLLQYKRIVDSIPSDHAARLSIVIVDDLIDQQQAEKIISENKALILYLCERADVMLPVHHCHIYKTKSLTEHAKTMLATLGYPSGLRLAIPTKRTLKTGLGTVRPRLDTNQIASLLKITKPNQTERYFKAVHFLALTENTDNNPDQFPLFERLLVCSDNGVDSVSMDGQRLSALFGNSKTSNRLGSVEQRNIECRQREIAVKSDPVYIGFSDHWADEPCLYEYFLHKIDSDLSSAIEFKSQFNQLIADDIEGDCQSTISESYTRIMTEYPSDYVRDIEQRLKSVFWQEISQLRPFQQPIKLQSDYREDAISSILNQETTKPQRSLSWWRDTFEKVISKKELKNLQDEKTEFERERSRFIKAECHYFPF